MKAVKSLASVEKRTRIQQSLIYVYNPFMNKTVYSQQCLILISQENQAYLNASFILNAML